MNHISFECSLPSSIEVTKVKDMLPNWKTKVQEIRHLNNSNIQIKCCVSAKTVDEIKNWLGEYEEKTNSVYSIKSTEKSSGVYVNFKQRLYCQHNTRCVRTYEIHKKNNTRNTNCPAQINITLRAVKKVYRGKDSSKAPDPEMPCEIVLQPIHNHETNSVDALRFQAVSVETIEKLLQLFKQGHTAATALESLKMDIQLNNEDYEKMLANRKYCPDYNFCYRLYMTEFREKYGPVETSPNLLIQYIDEYNQENGEKSIEAFFMESDQESNYAVSICPPLLRRVHKHIGKASEVVFIDSCGTINQEGTRVFILFTDTACGALPLGVILTSGESTDMISAGLELLRSMLGEDLFGGSLDGPQVFITNDSVAEQNAINTVFKNSNILLSTFHVLQAVWRWLAKARNGISREDVLKLFLEFRGIMYASTIKECELKYKEAIDNVLQYPNYKNFLEGYFNRRELWALAHRRNLLARDNYTTNNSEAAMRLLKNKIFQRTKGYNLIQTVDFVLTKFVSYYQRRLLDAAHNRSKRSIFDYDIKVPPPQIKEQIQKLSDEMYLVPSENTESLFYIVNTQILVCTCSDGQAEKICKHIHWACPLLSSETHVKTVDSFYVKNLFYLIATGNEAPENLFAPLFGEGISGALTEKPSPVKIKINSDLSNESYIADETEEENLLRKNKNVIDEIARAFLSFSERSPQEVGVALQKMKVNLDKVETVSAFTSSCTAFASANTP